jgi:hypothetical protein
LVSATAIPAFTQGKTLKAQGCIDTTAAGTPAHSAVATAAYTMNAGAIAFSTAAGTVANPTTITVTSLNSIQICYTTDGGTPACAANGAACTTGTLVSATAIPAFTADTTLKAQGCVDTTGAGTPSHSAVGSAAYVVAVNAGAIAFSTAAGTVANPTTITVTSADSIQICYTTDGTTPACAANGATCTTGTLVSDTAIPAFTADTTLKAQGCVDTTGAGTPSHSAVGSAAYVMAVDATTTTAPTTTAAPASTATTAAPAAKAAVDAGVQVTPNKMGILIAFLALFFIH